MPREAHDDPLDHLIGQAFDKLQDEIQAPPDFAARVLAEAQAHSVEWPEGALDNDEPGDVASLETP